MTARQSDEEASTVAQPGAVDFILLAAGQSTRFSQQAGLPAKQFVPLAGKTLISHCLDRLAAWPCCGQIILVLPEGMQMPTPLAQTMAFLTDHGLKIGTAAGGSSRAHSALNGLKALRKTGKPAGFVAVHDCARPLITHSVLDRLAAALDAGSRAVLPVMPVTDTLRMTGKNGEKHLIDRNTVFRMQTPQAFVFDDILLAYESAAEVGQLDTLSDDGMAAQAGGIKIDYVDGDSQLEKITYAEDMQKMQSRYFSHETRTASGFDVHKFNRTKSGPVMICGVAVEHEHGVSAHSDGDVGIHALCDAIFGALGNGDIGSFFPPSDPQWKAASSDRFLSFAVAQVIEAGGEIINLDVTIICERPKIGPVRQAMTERLSEICGLHTSRISVKATTSEGLGFTGRGEGIAALAQASIRLPSDYGESR